MRRVAALLFLVFVACDEREPVVEDVPGAAPMAEVESVPVSLSPPTAAAEVAPGVFILTLSGPLVPGSRIEDIPEILFVETIYDENGREAATSVPSSGWSVLSPESKVRLKGMREGERRRIWTCSGPEKMKCSVEDVMIGDRSKAISASGAT